MSARRGCPGRGIAALFLRARSLQRECNSHFLTCFSVLHSPLSFLHCPSSVNPSTLMLGEWTRVACINTTFERRACQNKNNVSHQKCISAPSFSVAHLPLSVAVRVDDPLSRTLSTLTSTARAWPRPYGPGLVARSFLDVEVSKSFSKNKTLCLLPTHPIISKLTLCSPFSS